MAICSGLDFGDFERLGLTPPNAFEVALLSKVRHYHNIVKIQPNGGRSCRVDRTGFKMRAHSILFEHDAPQQSCLALFLRLQQGPESIKDMVAERISIHFVAAKNDMDALIKHTLGTTLIQARAHVVYQWMQVLQAVNPLYSNDPPLPPLAEVETIIGQSNKEVLNQAVQITDEESLRFEAALGDDVAEVRTSGTDQSRPFDANAISTNGSDGSTTDPDQAAISYSAVCERQPCRYRNEGVTDNSLQTVQLLEQAASAFDVDVAPNVQRWLRSARAEIPLSEFDNPDFCLCGAFPHIFMYGSAYKQEYVAGECDNSRNYSRMSKEEHRHLLLQYTTLPATCRELIFYLFDQKQRHSTISGMWAKVHSNPKAFEQYGALMSSREFPLKLQQAIEKPKSKEAKEIVSDILPILSMAGNRTPFGAMEQNASIAEALALCQRHGPASVFLTVSPNDISNPTSFRFSFRSVNNKDFPAVAPADFLDSMKKEATFLGSGDVMVPPGAINTDYRTKAKRACTNPVAVVTEYQRLVQNILDILVGITSVERTRKSFYYADPKSPNNNKGVFGHILAMHGVHETQQRGALHFHVILWGGITPKLLEGAAQYQDLCTTISEVLQTMYTADLPREMLVQDLVQREMKKRFAPIAFHKKIGPVDVPSSAIQHNGKPWINSAQQNCLNTNMHTHSFTCHKPHSGVEGCRLARPCGISANTMPCLLQDLENQEVDPDDPMVDFCYTYKKEDLFGFKTYSIPPKKKVQNRDITQEPIPPPDDRVLVWELKRPEISPLPDIPLHFHDDESAVKTFCIQQLMESMGGTDAHNLDGPVSTIAEWMHNDLSADQVTTIYSHIADKLPEHNGLVTEFNDTIINTTGSAVNCILLGNSTQSKNALFYLAPYIGKSKVQLATCLTSLNNALQHVKKYPSTADDTGTNKRTAQHILTRTINSLNLKMEVCDTQAVLGLLDGGSQIKSHFFQYYGAQDAVNYVTREAYKSAMGIDNDTDLCSPDGTEFDYGFC